MNNMEVNSLVKVVDPESFSRGDEGIIICRIPSESGQDEIQVQFGPNRGKNCNWTETFRPEQLEQIEVFSTKVIAYREFPGMHHSTCDYNFEEGAPRKCMIAGCNLLDTHYTYVNYVGSVLRVRTCETHNKEYNFVNTECLNLGE